MVTETSRRAPPLCVRLTAQLAGSEDATAVGVAPDEIAFDEDATLGARVALTSAGTLGARVALTSADRREFTEARIEVR